MYIIDKIELSRLRPHPRNAEIYGNDQTSHKKHRRST